MQRRDRQAIARAARLQLRGVELDPGMIDVHGSGATASVHERYSFARVPGRFGTTRTFVLARRGGGWRVAGVRSRRGIPPWEAGDFRPRRTRHFVVLRAPSTRIDTLLTALERGYSAMRARLTQPLRRRYLVIVAAGPKQARALTDRIRGVGTLAAISDATISERGPARAVGKVVSLRLLVVDSAFMDLDPLGRRRTVAHELTHAALAGSTSGRTPAWLVEGVAMYVSGDRRSAPAHPDLATLSQPGAIARLTGAAQTRAYAASSAAAFAIADRWGQRKLMALYDSFNHASMPGGPGPQLVNQALDRELGISLRDLP
jgi:hypothetical protein